MRKIFTLFLFLLSVWVGMLQAQTEQNLSAWGINSKGQLGDGTSTDKYAPVQVGTTTNWTSITAGDQHSLAIKSNGTLWTWGRNDYGQLGDGTSTDKDVPVQVGTATNWTSITAGALHSLAIKSDGTLWAWGYNASGEVGDGTTTNKNTPVQVGSATNWTSITAGAHHNLAIKSDGTLWAWGNNYFGQLGDGTTTNKDVPVQVGTATNWSSITAGDLHSLAIKSDGTLWAWGYNAQGQLGDGTSTDKYTPMQVGSATNWASITAGAQHNLAVKSNGTLWTWGDNYYGQLGDGTSTDKYTPVQVGTATNWTSITAGAQHNLAVKSNGTLWTWGWNSHGQLGDGTTTNKDVPVQVGTATAWTSIAAGYNHSLALSALSNNAFLSALDISSGALSPVFASGTFSYSATVENVVSSITVTPTVADANATVTVNGTTVASGNTSPPIALNTGSNTISVVATAEDGTSTQTYTIDVNRLERRKLLTWGYNAYGQLGDGTTNNKYAPAQAGTATNWTSIAAGNNHSLAVKSDGTLWAWGDNYYGQLGDGTTAERRTPVQIGTATNWASISAGKDYSLAIKSDGTLWTWGRNQNGKLGDGTTTTRYLPVQIGTATNWTSIAAGTHHSLARKSDGTLWAWGYNAFGQLGNGTTTDRHAPVQIGTATNWTSIAARGFHSLAAKSDGTLWAWGYNSFGQLGDGTTTEKHAPVQIGTATNWTSISAGHNHNLAVKSDGTLWAWGYNMYGQLGDGTTTNRTTPVQVGTATNWTSISAGNHHSLAVKSDGTHWVWGINFYGQLGDGTNTNRTTPVQNGAATNWTSIAAGGGHSLALSTLSTNADLSALDISSGELSPLFASGTTTYSATVANVVSSVTITPTVADANATITVNETAVANGSASSPIPLNTGSNTISVVVTAEDGTSAPAYTIDVNRLENTAPVLAAIGAKTADELTTISFTATAIDNDAGQALTYSLVGAPTGAAITTAGVFSWTPTEVQGGADYSFTVKVSDNGTPVLSDEEAITVTVNEVNVAPVLTTIGNKAVDELTALSFTAAATDADEPANSLSFSLANPATGTFPTGAAISAAGAFSWTPTEAQGPGTYRVKIVVSDGTATDEEEIEITVNEVNIAPALATIGNKAVDELTELSFTATATDSDEPANTLSYSLVGAPTGAIITTAGAFSWTPTEAQGPNSYTFTVSVTNGEFSDSEEVTITVNEVNQAPVVTSEPVTSAREGDEYSYQLTATDADLPANTLTYEAIEIPSWLSFDAATQTINGIPDKTAEISSLIQLQVSDGQEVSTQEFTLEVEITTGLFDKVEQEHMLVYPNPTKGSLMIEMSDIAAEEKVSISLLSLEGRLLIQKNGSLQKGTESISTYLQEAGAGTYLLQVKAKESIRSIKVIKE